MSNASTTDWTRGAPSYADQLAFVREGAIREARVSVRHPGRRPPVVGAFGSLPDDGSLVSGACDVSLEACMGRLSTALSYLMGRLAGRG